MQLREAELNYPVHEKELLAIIRALKKWHVELLGTHVQILTDHRTLQNFTTQRDLLRRQARWAEYLSQYDFSITYIKGHDNCVADALSHRVEEPLGDTTGTPPVAVINIASGLAEASLDAVNGWVLATVLSVTADAALLDRIRSGYATDPWCQKLTNLLGSLPGLTQDDNGLFYIAGQLVIP
jgi:hypothetical protein